MTRNLNSRAVSSRTVSSRTAIAALTGLTAVTVVGALAGCTAAATTPADSKSGTQSATKYKDGSYTENGTYSSPGGTEKISVALTLKSNVVTAVTVKTIKADPTATSYEKLFEAGISKVVVGKDINSLKVSRVGGSSLTSQGFNDALRAIKADAKS